MSRKKIKEIVDYIEMQNNGYFSLEETLATEICRRKDILKLLKKLRILNSNNASEKKIMANFKEIIYTISDLGDDCNGHMLPYDTFLSKIEKMMKDK